MLQLAHSVRPAPLFRSVRMFELVVRAVSRSALVWPSTLVRVFQSVVQVVLE